MATLVHVKHTSSGLTKPGYYGFSWTYLFFGWLVPIFRGELGIAALHLLFTAFTLGIWQLIACFIYNKQYMHRMVTSGWEIVGSDEEIQSAKLSLGLS
jgi:hypothetical protein